MGVLMRRVARWLTSCLAQLCLILHGDNCKLMASWNQFVRVCTICLYLSPSLPNWFWLIENLFRNLWLSLSFFARKNFSQDKTRKHQVTLTRARKILQCRRRRRNLAAKLDRKFSLYRGKWSYMRRAYITNTNLRFAHGQTSSVAERPKLPAVWTPM